MTDELSQSRPLSVRLIIVVGLAALTISIYGLRLDRSVGLMLDDAWYILLAKSISSGQGYQVINSPTSGIHPLYPPGFPVLLSLVFRIAPTFPANLYWLKGVSIFAMLIVGYLTYRYFYAYRAESATVAYGLAIATVISPPLVVLATSTVMSECVFTFWLMITIVAIEHCLKQTNPQRFLLWGALAGLLAACAFLTRTMAVGLIFASVLFLLFKRRRAAACAFSMTVLLICLPWQLYSFIHKPTATQRQEQAGHIVRGYELQFWDQVAGYPALGTIDFTDLPARIWGNLLEIFGLNLGAIIANPFFPGLNRGEGERWGGLGTMISLLISGIVICGFIVTCRRNFSFAEIAVLFLCLAPLTWGFPQFRYLVPLTPLLYFYFLSGVRCLSEWHKRLSLADETNHTTRLATGVLLGFLGLSTFSHGYYLYLKFGASAENPPGWVKSFEEHEDLLLWARENIPKDSIVLTQNPALVYLYTGLKSVTFDQPTQRWSTWNSLGIRYFIRTAAAPLPENDPLEKKHQVLYRTNGKLKLRVTDLGKPDSRPVWGTP